MTEDWKELKIDNLPADYFTADYEFKSKEKRNKYFTSPWLAETRRERITILENIEDFDYHYRPRQPEPPTHEEILTKWWKIQGVWYRCHSYNPATNGYCFSDDYWINGRDYFTNRQSADLPEEG